MGLGDELFAQGRRALDDVEGDGAVAEAVPDELTVGFVATLRWGTTEPSSEADGSCGSGRGRCGWSAQVVGHDGRVGKRTSSKASKEQVRARSAQDARQRIERLEDRMSQARDAPADVRAAVFADAVAFSRSPQGRRVDWFDLPELLEESARALAQLGRTDEALAAAQEALDEGLAGEPDPRCLLADINYRAGHREEAEAIWAQVRAQTPDDVWLYNSVGMEKHYGGEHEQALEWLGRGLELAQAQGDPQQLIAQLLDFREGSLRALGRQDDDLQRRANAYRLADAARRMTLR